MSLNIYYAVESYRKTSCLSTSLDRGDNVGSLLGFLMSFNALSQHLWDLLPLTCSGATLGELSLANWDSFPTHKQRCMHLEVHISKGRVPEP